MVTLLLSGCVTGDEITYYIVDPDGTVAFSIYRLNLTSDEKGENAKKDLTNYVRGLEENRDSLLLKLAKANAGEVSVKILRRTSPASVLITGRIPSLNDFAAYASETGKQDSIICTSVSRERTRGIRCELIRKPSKEEARSEPAKSLADSFSQMRIALAEGGFTKAQGFIISNDRRSALLDMDLLSKLWENLDVRSIILSLEWQVPEAE
jgi:hypothetical protein